MPIFLAPCKNSDTTNTTAQNMNYFVHKSVANGNTKYDMQQYWPHCYINLFLFYLECIYKSNPHVKKIVMTIVERKNVYKYRKLNSPSVCSPQKSFNNFHCRKMCALHFSQMMLLKLNLKPFKWKRTIEMGRFIYSMKQHIFSQ